MIQKILMRSDKFKMRRDLEFIYRPQLIRSAHDIYAFFVGFVSHRATYNNVKIDFGILPVCTIWKLSIILSISSKQFSEHFLDFWYNSLMKRKIFNSYESRVKCDLMFEQSWQRGRSAHRRNNVVVSGVNWHGSVRVYYAHNNVIFVAPVCTIWKLSISLSISSKTI